MNAIKDHDTEIAQIIKDYYTDETKGFSENKKKFNELFIQDKSLISLDTLNQSIRNKIKDRVITRWDFYLNKLKINIKEKKNSLTPIIFLSKKKLNEDEKFFQWVHNIKLRKRSGDLMSYQIEELEKIGIDWKIKGETLSQLEVQKLVSFRKLRDKYFWFSRKGTQHLKPEGKYYTTSLGDYYDPNKVEKIKQKFKNYIHPNDQRYVSENQIIEAFNLQSARKKKNTNYHNF